MPYSRKNIFLCMRQRVLVDLLYLPENVKNLNSTYSAGQSRVPKSNNTMAGSLKQTMNKKVPVYSCQISVENKLSWIQI